MNYISVDILKKYNCCEGQVELFEKLFPTGIVEFNSLREAKLLAKKYSSKFDFDYLGIKVFGDTYQEDKKPHYDAYLEAIDHHYEAYKEAEKPLLDAYIEATRPHLDAYRSSKKPHLDTYKEAIKPHLDAYQEAIKPHIDAYQKSTKPHIGAYQEARSQVFAKLWFELEGDKL